MKLSGRVALCEKYEGETPATRAIKRWIKSGTKVWNSQFEIFFDTVYVTKPDGKTRFDTYPSFRFNEEAKKISEIIYAETQSEDSSVGDENEEGTY
jgi:hypothetical protein